MVPLIISTIPENGSDKNNLSDKVQIVFSSGILPPTLANFDVKNITQNTSVPFTIEFNEESPKNINLIIQDPNALSGNSFCGLCKYKISVKGIRSFSDGEKMTKIFSFSFLTEEEDILSIIENGQTGQSLFKVVSTYPENNAKYVSVEKIGVQYSDNIKIGENTEVIIINGDSSKIDFMDLYEIEPIDGEISVSGNVLRFTPASAFESNSQYSVLLKGIINEDGTTEAQEYRFSFTTKRHPFYGEENDIISPEYALINSITKGNTDYIEAIIFANSKRAQDIATNAGTFSLINWDSPPNYVYEYVAYKTRYDIIYGEYLKLASGASTKTLADLTIAYNYSIKDLLQIIDMLKKAYLKAAAQIEGTTLAAKSTAIFQKGSSVDTIPDFMNRAFKDMEGEKEW